jgi:ABC-type proline/glycine betaine transport system ATPase subunit
VTSGATEAAAADTRETTSSTKKVFVFVGDKGCGKTNLVLKMLDI